MTTTEFSLDGMTPQKIYIPGDEQETARILEAANEAHEAIIPWGGGTLQHLGNVPTGYAAALDTTRLGQIVDYAYDDLTLTVQAGMTLGQIEKALAEHGQYLPIDIPQPEHATIGGVLAAGANGPLRLRYGPARDFMLGNRFATVRGKVIKGGGKVVKNVAGYEIHKLMVGAYGTLGVLTEATFKIFPKPPNEVTLWAAFEKWQEGCAVVPKIWNLATAPMALELLDAKSAQAIDANAEGEWFVVARFGGVKKDMAEARSLATAAARENNARSADIIENATLLWRGIANLPATLRQANPTTTVIRVGVPPHELPAALNALITLADAQKIAAPRLFAHAASAIIYAALEGEDETLILFIQQLRAQLHELHGHLVIERAAASVKNQSGVWDEMGGSLKLMRALKHQFDPNNILNPGRFAGGI